MTLNDSELADLMTRPSQRLVDDIQKIEGDILIWDAAVRLALRWPSQHSAPLTRLALINR